MPGVGNGEGVDEFERPGYEGAVGPWPARPQMTRKRTLFNRSQESDMGPELVGTTRREVLDRYFDVMRRSEDFAVC